MAARILTVLADDPGHFFLRVEGGKITFGGDPAGPAAGLGAIHGLRVRGIRCEVDVGDEPVHVLAPEGNGHAMDRVIGEDEEIRIGSSRVRVDAALEEVEETEQPVAAAAPMAAPAAAPAAAPVAAAAAMHRLIVVDGVNVGKTFVLKPDGETRVGRDAAQVDFRLSELVVAPLHCRFETIGGRVFVIPRDSSTAVTINQRKVEGRTEVSLGDITRVGNTQLRLEVADDDDVAPRPAQFPATPATSVPVAAASIPTPDIWSDEEPEYRDRKREAAAQSTGAAKPSATPTVREPSPMEKVRRLEHQTLGHFHLREILGKGHVGVVFRADDLKTHHPMALKVISPEFPKTDAEIQNLGKMIKAAMTLRDSHLVGILGAGRTGAFTWVARELIEGESLADLLSNEAGPRGWRRACRLAAQVGAALDFLHQRKIVHGNVTPRNVLIRAEDYVAKLADTLQTRAFGGSHLERAIVAKKRDAEAAYLAPEQLEDAAYRPDSRCDLYALGVLCYELTVGRPPFPGDSVDEVRELVDVGSFAKPSKKQKDIPPPFEAALLKLLATNPADRFHEVGEFLEIVEPILMMYDIK